MENIITALPFLIPLLIAQLALLGYSLYHVLTHGSYKRGNRALWLVIVLLMSNFAGPILYLILGREDS